MLKRAVNSVLNQSYEPIEIIIVDDGSRDGTREYIESIRNENIKFLINEKNSGPCFSRNKAIFEASGKYITGLDDDDEFGEDHIKYLVEAFDYRYSFVTSSMLQVTKKGSIARNNNIGIHNLKSLLHYNKLTNQAFTLTERMRSVGGFDEQFPAMQDYDTWLRLVDKFGPALKIKSPTYIWHTDHESSRISRSTSKREKAIDLFFERYIGRMNLDAHNSYQILRCHMLGGVLSFSDLVRRINRQNWKMAIALYSNSHGFLIKSLYDKMRLFF